MSALIIVLSHIFKGNNFTGQFARWHLTIQEFNPIISYISSKANSMTDALSRNVATIFVMTENPAKPAMDEIRKHQRSDAFCSSVAYYLESCDNTNFPKLQVSVDTFFMQDNLLYESCDVSTDDSSERLSQLMIPLSLVSIIFQHVQDSPHAGYPGRDRCLAQAKRSYFRPTMKKNIFQHCVLCLQCV